MAGTIGIRCALKAALPSFTFGAVIALAGNLLMLPLSSNASAFAQGASPMPGMGSPPQQPAPTYAPIPGGLRPYDSAGAYGNGNGISSGNAGGGGNSARRGGPGSYSSLPLNATDASLRLDELRSMMPSARPKEFQEVLSNYIIWLSDVADGHWRMSTAFSKTEANKSQAEAEKQSALKFGGLKRQGMLLEAQFLVSQRRFPEAVSPLIEIVVAEPRTTTGKAAYKLLQDIGFSEVGSPISDARSTK